MEILVKPVEVYNYSTKEEFIKYTTETRKPLLVRGLDIGPCSTQWTVQYLTETIQNVPITAHVSPTSKMSFIKKNFTYMKMPFNEFLCRASGEGKSYKPLLCENEVLYYRSISFDKRGKECSDLTKLFPSISHDFIIPDVFNSEDFFSSIFRISSPNVQVWTHYDIMDNILVQIRGTKKIILFSPNDAEYLYMNGDKSEVLDVDNPDITQYPKFLCALQHECTMNPGEAIFIPALWFHNVSCKDFSISVNVFWKNLRHDLYDKKDVYGNKDLIPAGKAFAYIKKAQDELNALPHDYKRFYMERCINDLRSQLEKMKEEKLSGNGNLDKASQPNTVKGTSENGVQDENITVPSENISLESINLNSSTGEGTSNWNNT